MKSRVLAIAGSALAIMLLALAFAPGVLAQTPAPQRGNGNGNGVGPGAGNGQVTGNPNRGAGLGLGMGMGMGGPQNSLITVAASELGMTNAELITALGGTKSIAQVAAEHNVAVTMIVDAFLAPRVTALNAAVAAGRLTQAQADQMLTTMRTNVTEQVNEVWSPNGAGPGYADADGDGVCDNMGTGVRGGMGQGGMMGQGRGPRR